MLIITRRTKQSIEFPTLGISIQVLRVLGRAVRVGIQAPRSIPIFREELEPHLAASADLPEQPPLGNEAARRARHALRGRLNTATLALYLAQRQLEAGLSADAGSTLRHALAELQRLEGELAGSGQAPSRRIRALLVEDNAHESALLEGYLRLHGVDVVTVGDGDEALDYLATHELPDAVLLDMRLPRRDGAATLAAIRADPALAGLKVFAVSGRQPEEVGIPAGPAGVDAWFSKPLNPAQLMDTLALAVG